MNKIVHVPGHLNIVTDLMSRPPQVVPAPGSTMATSVKVPSGSLAASQVAGGTAGASPLHPVTGGGGGRQRGSGTVGKGAGFVPYHTAANKQPYSAVNISSGATTVTV